MREDFLVFKIFKNPEYNYQEANYRNDLFDFFKNYYLVSLN